MQAILFQTTKDVNGNSRKIVFLSGLKYYYLGNSDYYATVSSTPAAAIQTMLLRAGERYDDFPPGRPNLANKCAEELANAMVGPFQITPAEYRRLKKLAIAG